VRVALKTDAHSVGSQEEACCAGTCA
jgi:hypothetical protein